MNEFGVRLFFSKFVITLIKIILNKIKIIFKKKYTKFRKSTIGRGYKWVNRVILIIFYFQKYNSERNISLKKIEVFEIKEDLTEELASPIKKIRNIKKITL